MQEKKKNEIKIKINNCIQWVLYGFYELNSMQFSFCNKKKKKLKTYYEIGANLIYIKKFFCKSVNFINTLS